MSGKLCSSRTTRSTSEVRRCRSVWSPRVSTPSRASCSRTNRPMGSSPTRLTSAALSPSRAAPIAMFAGHPPTALAKVATSSSGVPICCPERSTLTRPLVTRSRCDSASAPAECCSLIYVRLRLGRAQGCRHGYPRGAQRGQESAKKPHREGPDDAVHGEREGNRKLETVTKGTRLQPVEEQPRQSSPERRPRQRQQDRLAQHRRDDGRRTEADGAQRRQLRAPRGDDCVQGVCRPERGADRHDRADKVADEVQQRVELLERILDRLTLALDLQMQRGIFFDGSAQHGQIARRLQPDAEFVVGTAHEQRHDGVDIRQYQTLLRLALIALADYLPVDPANRARVADRKAVELPHAGIADNQLVQAGLEGAAGGEVQVRAHRAEIAAGAA